MASLAARRGYGPLESICRWIRPGGRLSTTRPTAGSARGEHGEHGEHGERGERGGHGGRSPMNPKARQRGAPTPPHQPRSSPFFQTEPSWRAWVEGDPEAFEAWRAWRAFAGDEGWRAWRAYADGDAAWRAFAPDGSAWRAFVVSDSGWRAWRAWRAPTVARRNRVASLVPVARCPIE